jgi:hypothetical protein
MKDYAAKLERDSAARLLRQALSAEPDFTEEGNARLADARFARLLDDVRRGCERGILVEPVEPNLP